MEKSKFVLEFEKPIQVLEEQLESLKKTGVEHGIDVSKEVKSLEATIEKTKRGIFGGLSAWQKVQMARHPERPYSMDYIGLIFSDFEELHGDRLYKDDQAIIGGVAFLDGMPVMVIGQQKGRNLKENLRRNFGSPNPEGYRKALRLMRMAEKFGLPVVSFVDTPGAYAGVEAEERHIGEAIAVNIREMSVLKTPIVAVVIGEGGSGGALGVAVADSVLILEHAYYSVISPEGCAMILWKDRQYTAEAAEALKLTSDRLLEMGIVDGVIEEPLGGAHTNKVVMAEAIKKALVKEMERFKKYNGEELLEHRYSKYRRMGVFEERAVVE